MSVCEAYMHTFSTRAYLAVVHLPCTTDHQIRIAWCRPPQRISSLPAHATHSDRSALVRAWWKYGCEVRACLQALVCARACVSGCFECVRPCVLGWTAPDTSVCACVCACACVCLCVCACVCVCVRVCAQAVKLMFVSPGGGKRTLRIDPDFLQRRCRRLWRLRCTHLHPSHVIARTHTHTHTHKHARTHTHTHTHTPHTHTHTLGSSLSYMDKSTAALKLSLMCL